MQPKTPPMILAQTDNSDKVTSTERKRSIVVYYEHLITEVPAVLEWKDNHVCLYYLDNTTGALGSLIFDAPVSELSHVRLALAQLRMSYTGKEYVLDFDRVKTAKVQVGLLGVVSPVFLLLVPDNPNSSAVGKADLAWWVTNLRGNGIVLKEFKPVKVALIGLGVLVLLFVAWFIISLIQEFIKNGP